MERQINLLFSLSLFVLRDEELRREKKRVWNRRFFFNIVDWRERGGVLRAGASSPRRLHGEDVFLFHTIFWKSDYRRCEVSSNFMYSGNISLPISELVMSNPFVQPQVPGLEVDNYAKQIYSCAVFYVSKEYF
jgi:hypothetical protein